MRCLMSQTAAATTVAANPDNMNMELLVVCELQVDRVGGGMLISENISILCHFPSMLSNLVYARKKN